MKTICLFSTQMMLWLASLSDQFSDGFKVQSKSTCYIDAKSQDKESDYMHHYHDILHIYLPVGI